MHLDMLLRTILREGVHLHSRAQIGARLCLPLGITWFENLQKREVRSCGLRISQEVHVVS